MKILTELIERISFAEIALIVIFLIMSVIVLLISSFLLWKFVKPMLFGTPKVETKKKQNRFYSDIEEEGYYIKRKEVINFILCAIILFMVVSAYCILPYMLY